MSSSKASNRALPPSPGDLRCDPGSLRRAGDERIVRLAGAGYERAFDEIVRRYERQLGSYCARLVGGDRAADVVQQTFMQALKTLRRGGGDEICLRPWLYRVARNYAIDMLRRNGWDHDQLDPEYDGVPQPPQLVEQKEHLARVVGSILALPEPQRQALTMRELEGRSYEEISALTGRTPAGVRQLIFRARASLR